MLVAYVLHISMHIALFFFVFILKPQPLAPHYQIKQIQNMARAINFPYCTVKESESREASLNVKKNEGRSGN